MNLHEAPAAIPVDKWMAGNPLPDLAALDQFRQGSLLPGTTFVWAGPAGVDPVTGEQVDAMWDSTSSGPHSSWSIVTSQTCDIGTTGPGRHHPFVQVSPVVDFAGYDANFLTAARRYELTYLAFVSNVPAEGSWFADLRISVPVSKGLLLQCDVHPGFTSEAEFTNFAEHLAHRLRRPAVSDRLIDNVGPILDDTIRTTPKNVDRAWYEDVEQVRAELTPSPLAPTFVQLHVIALRALEPSEKERWRGARKRIVRALANDHIKVGPIRFHHLDKVAAKDYRAWIPIRVSQLGRPDYYW